MRQFDMVRSWRSAIGQLTPEVLVPRHRAFPRPDEAVLYWGKAAARTFSSFPPESGFPGLVISNENAPDFLSPGVRWVRGEHPLPGEGSFEAGAALLDFFDCLRRFRVSRLRIFLSGGASSLAWIPNGISRKDLPEALSRLYARGLDIDRLNRERSRLCGLKNGGAARWLRSLAPGVHARVELISDVAPFGPEVVGSGPFWGDGIPHRVLADNCDLVGHFAQEARKFSVPILGAECGQARPAAEIVSKLAQEARRAARASSDGLFLVGCEPSLELHRASGRGGRMTQVAADLLDRLWFLERRFEILCASSDGSDGNSGAAAVRLSPDEVSRVRSAGERERRRLRDSIRRFDSAGYFAKFRRSGAASVLIPSFSSGTNVQDLMVLRVMAGPLL